VYVSLESGAPADRANSQFYVNGRGLHPLNVRMPFDGCATLVTLWDVDAHASRMGEEDMVMFDADQTAFQTGCVLGNGKTVRRNRLKPALVDGRWWCGAQWGDMEWRRYMAQNYAGAIEGMDVFMRLRERVLNGEDVRIPCVPQRLSECLGMYTRHEYVVATAESLTMLYRDMDLKRFPHEVIVAMILSGFSNLI